MAIVELQLFSRLTDSTSITNVLSVLGGNRALRSLKNNRKESDFTSMMDPVSVYVLFILIIYGVMISCLIA